MFFFFFFWHYTHGVKYFLRFEKKNAPLVYVGLTFDYRLEKTSVTFNPYIDEVSRIFSKQIMKSNLTRLGLHFLIRKRKICS